MTSSPYPFPLSPCRLPTSHSPPSSLLLLETSNCFTDDDITRDGGIWKNCKRVSTQELVIDKIDEEKFTIHFNCPLGREVQKFLTSQNSAWRLKILTNMSEKIFLQTLKKIVWHFPLIFPCNFVFRPSATTENLMSCCSINDFNSAAFRWRLRSVPSLPRKLSIG